MVGRRTSQFNFCFIEALSHTLYCALTAGVSHHTPTLLQFESQLLMLSLMLLCSSLKHTHTCTLTLLWLGLPIQAAGQQRAISVQLMFLLQKVLATIPIDLPLARLATSSSWLAEGQAAGGSRGRVSCSNWCWVPTSPNSTATSSSCVGMHGQLEI